MRAGRVRHAAGFAERLTHGFVEAMERALDAESLGARPGFLQGLDPRAKLISLFALILGAVLTRSLIVLVALLLLAVALALASQVSIARLFKQVWIGVLLFTGVIALPATVLVPGDPIGQLPVVHLSISAQGLRSALFLVGRAEVSATLASLLVLTTPWTHVLKALRSLGVPVVVVATLGMTHRYIFVLLHAATQMFEALRSRLVVPVAGTQKRAMVASCAGVLLDKTFLLSTEVHLAMLSRGYRGDIRLLDEFRMRWRDGFVLSCALALAGSVLYLR